MTMTRTIALRSNSHTLKRLVPVAYLAGKGKRNPLTHKHDAHYAMGLDGVAYETKSGRGWRRAKNQARALQALQAGAAQ